MEAWIIAFAVCCGNTGLDLHSLGNVDASGEIVGAYESREKCDKAGEDWNRLYNLFRDEKLQTKHLCIRFTLPKGWKLNTKK